MTSREIVTAAQIDAPRLDSFLSRSYCPAKAGFLRDHASWWYRGEQNRWVILEGSEIAAYCGVIPGRLLTSGDTVDVSWWVDLVVAPEFRGRGLQRVLDDRVKSTAPLITGFPNSLAAGIHRHHGWGVRDDLRVLLMPLRPGHVGAVQRQGGLRGTALRAAALAMEPAATLLRRRLRRWKGTGDVRTDRPKPSELERVFLANRSAAGSTTLRDERYLRWRFFEAPYLDELTFFRAGTEAGSEIVAITRLRRQNGVRTVRILDLFGAVAHRATLQNLVMEVGREAVRQEAAQITLLATDRPTRNVLRSLGFVAATRAHFCWWSSDRTLVNGLARNDNYWVLADSDNDEP